MAGMYGADVAQLRTLAEQFDRLAGQLDADRMSVGNAIQVSAWVGPVAVRFRHQWESQHSRQVSDAAARLRDAAKTLRKNADEQERASAVDSGSGPRSGGPLPSFDLEGVAMTGDEQFFRRWLRDNPGGTREQWKSERWGTSFFEAQLRGHFPGLDDAPWSSSPGQGPGDFFDFVLNDLIVDSSKSFSTTVDVSGLIVEHLADAKFDPFDAIPKGSYISSSLKGISLGDASARFAAAVRDRDWSGAMLAGADAAFTFTPPGVSLLWDGMSGMTGFFIPLDKAAQDEHFSWLEDRYSPSQIVDRYQGVQGFINLGNDNVERKAPWLNRLAEKATEKPAQWLYNMGIKLY